MRGIHFGQWDEREEDISQRYLGSDLFSSIRVGMPYTFSQKVLHTAISSLPQGFFTIGVDMTSRIKIPREFNGALTKIITKNYFKSLIGVLFLKYLYYFHDFYERYERRTK